MEKLFKVSAITLAIIGFIASTPVSANDPLGPEYAKQASKFFADSTISGSVAFWMRARDRAGYDETDREDTKKQTNLDHGSIFANLGFHSGYIGETVGLDAVIYSTFDMWQNGGADHEMNFWGVNNPYDKEPSNDSCEAVWSDCTDNGASFSTATLKFKFGESGSAKLGYFQPSVPTSLGVNWTFAPGTYRGGEIGYEFGALNVGLVIADEYKAPWFKNTYGFRTTDGEDAGTVYSVGANYVLDSGTILDFGYGGLTDGDRKNLHIKVKNTTDNGLYLSPQLYIVDDSEQYNNTAFQLALISSQTFGQYSFRADMIYTDAESKDKNSVGNMSYRLTSEYGGSNGAYDVWWNNRSDFNHDGELAGFLSATRDFSDIGGEGFSAGISAAAGAGAKANGYKELVEYAYSLFANYAIQEGALKDANISMHYTQFYNESDAGDWAPYSNAFNDETDFKLILSMPFSVK